ncbi:tRNA methyltransferase 10 homolog A [Trichonephila inaurata madagascariensis]|uniref:tRNA (guanine(9)-N(1))-methyltransferase n=1 Tax=Trichonephila inaurata madagascariensis TaxID=2747483 RepID=A0A8X6YHV8_9ARAC|nr:tRNA methyltransferase 10 homolog A [Trichonephila inaurata madagascariensis]
MADDIVSEKENTQTDGNPETVSAEPLMSKNKLKKLEKRRRWLEMKPLLKAKKKQKRKEKVQEAKQSGRDLGPSRKLLKSLKMSNSTCKLKICFDLSLAEVMTPPEFSKTFKQLHRCYSINRRAPAPLQLHITGYSEATKDLLSKMSGCFNWDVNFNSSTHAEIFSKEKIIYLTSDSPNVIEELDHDKVYVIGALVDHNRLKNICYEKAIKEVTEGKSWIDAIMDTVPKRKGVELKEDFKKSSDNGVQNRTEMDDSTENNQQDSSAVENSEENANEDHNTLSPSITD